MLMALGDGGIGPALIVLAITLVVNLLLENLLEPVLGPLGEHAYARAGLVWMLGLLVAWLAALLVVLILRQVTRRTSEPADDRVVRALRSFIQKRFQSSVICLMSSSRTSSR